MTTHGMASSELSQIGKYEVIARIAQGGMAEIFLARQPGIGGFSRRVVLKCILPALAEEPRFVQMFMEEARLASQIHHPNVVQIFDVGEEDDEYFIAMEYIDGLSVGDMATLPNGDQRTFPISVAGEIVAQACLGLQAAHKLTAEDGKPLGLVHRDVSPQNLMVSRDGVVKLVDFGIAKAQDSSVRTRTGNIKGKYAYMSPEQVRGQPLDRRSDIFSLGTLFFELITGHRLFHRSAELAILVAIIEDPFPSAHELDSSIPVELSDIILKSLQRDREERYATAAELGTAVREVLGSLGHYTSPETVEKYLEDECEEQLSARKIDQLGLGTPVSGKGLPADKAPAHESSRHVVPEIIDLPPPGGMRPYERERAKEEAKRSGNRVSWTDEGPLEGAEPVQTGKGKPQKEKPIVIVDERNKGPLAVGALSEEDDDDLAEAETAVAAIPPEREPTQRRPPAPLLVEAPGAADLAIDDDLDDIETIERVIDSEESDAVTAVIFPSSPNEQKTENLDHEEPEESDETDSSRPSESQVGWIEVATASALPDLGTAQDEAAPIDQEMLGDEDQEVQEDEPLSVEYTELPEESDSSEEPTETDRSTPPELDVDDSRPASRGPIVRSQPDKQDSRRWMLRAGIIGVLVLALGAAIGYGLSSRGGRPSGAPLFYAHPPSYPETTIVEEFRPLADYLQRQMHRPVDLVSAPDYESMQNQLLNGKIHFANLPPLLFVLARERDPNLKVLVVHAFERSKTDQSYIIARDDTEIRAIEQLKGKTFCHPDPRSTTGYLLPRRFLRSKGLDPDQLFAKVVFSKGHVGVMEDIVAGRCDAGAVISSAWRNAPDLGIKSHRLVMVTLAGETMRDVVCASPKLPTSLTESLRRALLDFQPQRDIGREAISPLFVIDRFVKVRPEDFDSVEEAAREEGLIQ